MRRRGEDCVNLSEFRDRPPPEKNSDGRL